MSRPQCGTPPSRWPLLAASSVCYKALEGGIGKTSPFPLLFLSLSLLIWQSLLKVGYVALVSHSVVSSSATPRTVARQAPLSVEFSRQEYWSGLPFPSPGDFPDPGIKPGSPACRQTLYCLSHRLENAAVATRTSLPPPLGGAASCGPGGPDGEAQRGGLGGPLWCGRGATATTLGFLLCAPPQTLLYLLSPHRPLTPP